MAEICPIEERERDPAPGTCLIAELAQARVAATCQTAGQVRVQAPEIRIEGAERTGSAIDKYQTVRAPLIKALSVERAAARAGARLVPVARAALPAWEELVAEEGAPVVGEGGGSHANHHERGKYEIEII